MEFPITVESQADFDNLVKDRLTRERAKFEGHDELKTQVDELTAKLTESSKEIVRATKAAEAAEARATTAETWKTDREAADALATVRAEVATATGVPADVLRGTTKEELTAHAESLKPLLGQQTQGPLLPDQGGTPNNPASTEAGQFATSLFGGGDD